MSGRCDWDDGIKESDMKDQDKERRKRSIKLGLLFGFLALFVYLGSMYYLIWQR